MVVKNLDRFLVIIFLGVAILASGCVSTMSQPRQAGDPEAAYQQHLKLAMHYIGAKNRDLARVHLEKAGQIDSGLARAQVSRLYNGYALLYQLELETELAEAHYRKAITSNKHDSMVRYNYAAFLFNQSRFKEALKQIQVSSDDLGYGRRPQAFYIMGLCQSRLNKSEQALSSFEKATHLEPRFADPYLEIGEIYFGQQKYFNAKRVLDQYALLAQSTAKSLWLSVRLEGRLGNRDKASSQGLQLKNLFPYSKENVEYQKWLNR
jgi:type IV pilus assembly protein PilF